jgi:hypothetical protein
MATTTPNYGWDVPTSTDYVKDGATAIETLGDDIDATLYTALGGTYPGLRLVKKQTIGTGVTTVTVSSAFNATYENYKVIISGGVGSANAVISIRVGGVTSGYLYAAYGANYAGTTFLDGQASAASVFWAGGCNGNGIDLTADINSPFANKPTVVKSQSTNTTFRGFNCVAQLNNTTSYSDITFFPDSGTLTGGTIYIYGYGIS